jgi:hypothetical protein
MGRAQRASLFDGGRWSGIPQNVDIHSPPAGFPGDVKDRELHNLLRYFPGFEACQMNWKSGQPQVGGRAAAQPPLLRAAAWVLWRSLDPATKAKLA